MINSSDSPSAEFRQEKTAVPFDPHAERLDRRDWTFIGFLAALGIAPLIAVIFIIYALLHYYPNFDNFPKGAAPMLDYSPQPGPLPNGE